MSACRKKRLLGLLACAGVVTGAGVLAGFNALDSAAGKACGWNVLRTSDTLEAVTAVSAADAWAVGDSNQDTDSGDQSQAVIYHWDGQSWHSVDPPLPDGKPSHLGSVIAVSRDDVWAAGYGPDNSSLVEHWDGKAWQISRVRPLGGRIDWINGFAHRRNDLWIYGFPPWLLEQWNGKRWTSFPRPASTKSLTGQQYADVDVSPAGDAWAVGEASPGHNRPEVPIAEHWTSNRWRLVSTPRLARQFLFTHVTAIGPNDAWLVGTSRARRLPRT